MITNPLIKNSIVAVLIIFSGTYLAANTVQSSPTSTYAARPTISVKQSQESLGEAKPLWQEVIQKYKKIIIASVATFIVVVSGILFYFKFSSQGDDDKKDDTKLEKPDNHNGKDDKDKTKDNEKKKDDEKKDEKKKDDEKKDEKKKDDEKKDEKKKDDEKKDEKKKDDEKKDEKKKDDEKKDEKKKDDEKKDEKKKDDEKKDEKKKDDEKKDEKKKDDEKKDEKKKDDEKKDEKKKDDKNNNDDDKGNDDDDKDNDDDDEDNNDDDEDNNDDDEDNNDDDEDNNDDDDNDKNKDDEENIDFTKQCFACAFKAKTQEQREQVTSLIRGFEMNVHFNMNPDDMRTYLKEDISLNRFTTADWEDEDETLNDGEKVARFLTKRLEDEFIAHYSTRARIIKTWEEFSSDEESENKLLVEDKRIGGRIKILSELVKQIPTIPDIIPNEKAEGGSKEKQKHDLFMKIIDCISDIKFLQEIAIPLEKGRANMVLDKAKDILTKKEQSDNTGETEGNTETEDQAIQGVGQDAGQIFDYLNLVKKNFKALEERVKEIENLVNEDKRKFDNALTMFLDTGGNTAKPDRTYFIQHNIKPLKDSLDMNFSGNGDVKAFETYMLSDGKNVSNPEAIKKGYDIVKADWEKAISNKDKTEYGLYASYIKRISLDDTIINYCSKDVKDQQDIINRYKKLKEEQDKEDGWLKKTEKRIEALENDDKVTHYLRTVLPGNPHLRGVHPKIRAIYQLLQEAKEKIDEIKKHFNIYEEYEEWSQKDADKAYDLMITLKFFNLPATQQAIGENIDAAYKKYDEYKADIT